MWLAGEGDVMVIVSIPLVTASHRLHIAHWATLPLTTSTDDSVDKRVINVVLSIAARQQQHGQ